MRHLLMDPAFPDIVGQWAAQQGENKARGCVNGNGDEGREDLLPRSWRFSAS